MFFKYLFILISLLGLFIISSCKKTITDSKPLDATISTWPKVGTGITGFPHYLYVDAGGALYAAGNTGNYTCGASVSFVSKLTGNTWSQLGTGSNALNVNGSILTMCGDAGGNIYVAGLFTDSTSSGYCNVAGNSYVAKWNGTSWSMLGLKGAMGLNQDRIISIAISPVTGYLFAATYSYFTQTNEVVFWNGNSWHTSDSAATKLNGNINKLCFDNAGNLYVGGYFTNTSGKTYIAKWNGTSWVELGGANSLKTTGVIYDICIDAIGNLYTGTSDWTSSYMAKWNGTTWTEIASPSELSTYRMCLDVAGNLYVGSIQSQITALDNTSYIAKWDGSSWSVLGKNTLFAYRFSSIVTNPTGGIYATGGLIDANNQSYVGKYP